MAYMECLGSSCRVFRCSILEVAFVCVCVFRISLMTPKSYTLVFGQ